MIKVRKVMDKNTLVIILAGFAAGFINTLASSGSAITLPLLIFLGISPDVANGTNRVPIVASSAVSLLTFHQAKVIDWRSGLLLAIPITLGSLAGAALAADVPPQALGKFIIAAVAAALFLLLVKPGRWLKAQSAETSGMKMKWIHLLIFFGVGFWAGFIVLDSATYMLFALVLGVGYDLIRANAVKSLFLLFVSLSSLLIFYEHREVDWQVGGVLAIGSVFGGWAGARMASKEWAKVWVYRTLVIIVVAEILHLIYKFFFLHQ
jgi:uncharacterized membrane protein YfcA